MKIGVFLLIEPFASVEVQLARAREMGFTCADITDTNSGGSMLGTAGFSPTISLDENPFEVKRLFERYGIEPTAVCAHAGLLEPSSPGTYGTAEIMKAVQFAAAMGSRGVLLSPSGARTLRAVTNRHVTQGDVETAIGAARSVLLAGSPQLAAVNAADD